MNQKASQKLLEKLIRCAVLVLFSLILLTHHITRWSLVNLSLFVATSKRGKKVNINSILALNASQKKKLLISFWTFWKFKLHMTSVFFQIFFVFEKNNFKCKFSQYFIIYLFSVWSTNLCGKQTNFNLKKKQILWMF